MAKQIITKLLDDINGEEADETVTFALDGVAYDIDLSSPNSSKLRDLLAPYISAGHRLGRLSVNSATGRLRPSVPADTHSFAETRQQNLEVRAWAQNNGWLVSNRGRIPEKVVEAFKTKTPNPDWVAARQAKRDADEAAAATKAAGSKATPAKKAAAAPRQRRGGSRTAPEFTNA